MVCRRLRLAPRPGLLDDAARCRSTPAPRRRSAGRRARPRRASRNSSTSGKLWPVSTCITGNGSRAGQNAFSASRSITIESLPPENSSTGPLELRRDLADDVDRLGLERPQVREFVRRRHAVLRVEEPNAKWLRRARARSQRGAGPYVRDEPAQPPVHHQFQLQRRPPSRRQQQISEQVAGHPVKGQRGAQVRKAPSDHSSIEDRAPTLDISFTSRPHCLKAVLPRGPLRYPGRAPVMIEHRR